MTRRFLLGLLFSLLLAPCAMAQHAQTQDSPPARPSVINSTFVVTFDRVGGATTYHLREENGRLLVDAKSERIGYSYSHSVEYEKVNYVRADLDLLDRYGGKRHVQIEDSNGRYLSVTLPTEVQADELAGYVARKSVLGLEFIGGAWRVRKRFECPEAGQPGCRDFKELLDHDDPDVAEFFYSRGENTHVCFSNEERRFFIVQYSPYAEYATHGMFELHAFKNGQSDMSNLGMIDWRSGGFGVITEWGAKRGEKPQRLGYIDASSLSLQTKFTNRINTTTQYSLDIRWSTGRYTESYSSKDEKGKPTNFDWTGVCVKLN